MNGIKLFRVFGITVFMHWSWFLIAAIEIENRKGAYSSVLWNVLEYVLLFAVVLMHEFGHALACRSVGGQAERIMLWPLGGIAYVNPPPRPGALLWSITAGPLVNVALAIASIPLWYFPTDSDAGLLIHTMVIINITLLIFNMLPIYPLDGGQILQSLMWFVMGRGRSMAVATVIGMIGAAGLAALAIYFQNWWGGVMAFFVASRCWSGWKAGVLIRERENAQPRAGFACPACGTPPITGKFWLCGKCKTSFDTFETGAICPSCSSSYPVTQCSQCRTQSPISAWQQVPIALAPATPLIQPAAASSANNWM